MDAKPLRFIRRGETVTLHGVPPDRTLLDLLREDLHACGSKEGCGEGDCGACTVVVAEPAPEGAPRPLVWRAINSCIRLAHSVDGLALWTVEDLAAESGALHPAQEAMVQCHGSQCGFCTPGFVMSLFGLYQTHARQGEAITPELAQSALSGNLCRCTGYRPILDAACRMAELPAAPALPGVPATSGPEADEAALATRLRALTLQAMPATDTEGPAYSAPTTLSELLALRAARPQAQVVAGCTDVGLWVTKQHRRYTQVLDVTRAQELRALEDRGDRLSIGAAVPLADAFAALVARRPGLATFTQRFAGLPVRNSGTLGGNVANGSPIGDSMPLLIALGASVVLASLRGERQMPVEDFYTGYRKNHLAADEILAYIDIPLAAGTDGHWLRVDKISKRFDDDISAVCLAVRVQLSQGQVVMASIGAGGVAATPVRARRTEAALVGQPWNPETVARAVQVLRGEFEPISDMRASADYRREVLGSLLQRLWLQTQGQSALSLESLEPGELA